MGNSEFQPASGHTTTTGVFCRGYVENTGVKLAPQVGFEPTTLRLTAECSTVELLRSKVFLYLNKHRNRVSIHPAPRRSTFDPSLPLAQPAVDRQILTR